MARIDTAAFWKNDFFHWHHKPSIVPIDPDPVEPPDPCDLCPEGYICKDWVCKPKDSWWGSSWWWTNIDPTPPIEDTHAEEVETDREAIEAEACLTVVPHNNWVVETQSWYITWADATSWAKYFFNASCYEEISFYWRFNDIDAQHNNKLRFWFVWDESTSIDADLDLYHSSFNLKGSDILRVTFRPSWDFRIEVQRVIDEHTAYEFETLVAANVNSQWYWNPTWSHIVDLAAKKLMVWVEWAACIMKTYRAEIWEVAREFPSSFVSKWVYTDIDLWWTVELTNWAYKATETMLWLDDWYNQGNVSYSWWVLKVGKKNVETTEFEYNVIRDMQNSCSLIDVVFNVDLGTNYEAQASVTINCIDGYDTHINVYKDGTVYFQTFSRSGWQTIEEEVDFQDASDVTFRIVYEIYTTRDSGFWERSPKPYTTDLSYKYQTSLYYYNNWEWVKVCWASLQDAGDAQWSNFTIETSSTYSILNIQYVRTSTKLESDWLRIMYFDSIDWNYILYYRDDGEIHLKLGDYSNIIADKNLWATKLADPHKEQNFDLDEIWYYYQWWNDYWFSKTWPFIKTETKVDTSDYWPDNHYYSNVLYDGSWNDWSLSPNPNLWWWVTDTNESKQWPCPKWWHIPSKGEMQALYNAIKTWEWFCNTPSLTRYLAIPFAWQIDNWEIDLWEEDGHPFYALATATSSNNNLAWAYYSYTGTCTGSMSDSYKMRWYQIRPFKNLTT